MAIVDFWQKNYSTRFINPRDLQAEAGPNWCLNSQPSDCESSGLMTVIPRPVRSNTIGIWMKESWKQLTGILLSGYWLCYGTMEFLVAGVWTKSDTFVAHAHYKHGHTLNVSTMNHRYIKLRCLKTTLDLGVTLCDFENLQLQVIVADNVLKVPLPNIDHGLYSIVRGWGDGVIKVGSRDGTAITTDATPNCTFRPRDNTEHTTTCQALWT